MVGGIVTLMAAIRKISGLNSQGNGTTLILMDTQLRTNGNA